MFPFFLLFLVRNMTHLYFMFISKVHSFPWRLSKGTMKIKPELNNLALELKKWQYKINDLVLQLKKRQYKIKIWSTKRKGSFQTKKKQKYVQLNIFFIFSKVPYVQAKKIIQFILKQLLYFLFFWYIPYV